MAASLPFNRIGFDSHRVEAELPPLPKSSRERGELWSDAVLHAVLTLKRQLTHQDAAIAMGAANSILELERTRIRHGRNVAGSEIVTEARRQFDEEESRRHDRMEVKPSAKPDVAAGARTDEQAFAEHVAEVTEYSEDDPLGVPPERFVTWLLDSWNLAASAIPAGGLMDRLREKGTGPGGPTR